MPLSRVLLLFTVFFLSGAAGLLYQVMWMKELSLLFGSSTQSAAVTTAAFFLGLGLGAQFISRWVKSRSIVPGNEHQTYLKDYALLEIAIGVTALLYFLIYPLFNTLYASLFDWLSTSDLLLLSMKFLLAIGLLTIPAFFMGGTLPVMAELVTAAQSTFPRQIAGVYFINTFGACTGAVAGGFWLPRAFGFTNTYLIAVGISLSLGVLIWLYRHTSNQSPLKQQKAVVKKGNNATGKPRALPGYVPLIAAFSGFASLALQVLWTRLFSQVLQNSTYTYSAILVVFLFALTLGALIARRLSSTKSPLIILASALMMSALLVALTPFTFMLFTNDMSYVGGRVDLTDYIIDVIGLVAITIGPAVVLMGIALPLLYKVVHADIAEHYAETVGKINAINTYAAIIGSLAAGFLLFSWLGTWQAIFAISLLYMLASVLLFARFQAPRHYWPPIAVVAVVVILLNPGKLPVVPVDPINKKEHLLDVWEGSTGTVAVVERDGNRKTKLNNWYALGGSKAKQMEAMQTHLPLNLHGKAESVFYLGLGTGVTAGTVLDYSVKNVVVAELVKEVITASERYFTEFNNGLFSDDRVRVVNEDGRHYLQATSEQFDLIIADLFIPWRAGVGNLYSLEHYQSALTKLNDEGLYVQWLPLYQISEAEFTVIARTMKQVFPTVTIWRGDFFANKPVIALIGHTADARLEAQRYFRANSIDALRNYAKRGQVPLISHYIGQISEHHEMFKHVALNTDDKPIIEYQAPISHRAEKQGLINWLTGADMLSVFRQLQAPQDSYLTGLTEPETKAIYAGYFLQAAQVAKELKDEQAHNAAMQQFKALINN